MAELVLYRCGIIVPYNEGKCTLQMIMIMWCDSKSKSNQKLSYRKGAQLPKIREIQIILFQIEIE